MLKLAYADFPCRSCAARRQGCHSRCEKYIAAKEKNDAIRVAVQEGKEKMRICWIKQEHR